MEIKDSRIDAGKAFDWGRTSKEYAKYRDIYPEKFYRKIVDRGLCVKGQRALDLGTGTGVLPRNLYSYGAEWTGTDISPEQIREAKILSEAAGLKIDFQTVPAEEISSPDVAYDYFVMEDHEEYDLMVPFTRESWHGRMRACRGVGASLSEDELVRWDEEHRNLLNMIPPWMKS